MNVIFVVIENTSTALLCSHGVKPTPHQTDHCDLPNQILVGGKSNYYRNLWPSFTNTCAVYAASVYESSVAPAMLPNFALYLSNLKLIRQLGHTPPSRAIIALLKEQWARMFLSWIFLREKESASLNLVTCSNSKPEHITVQNTFMYIYSFCRRFFPKTSKRGLYKSA